MKVAQHFGDVGELLLRFPGGWLVDGRVQVGLPHLRLLDLETTNWRHHSTAVATP